MHTLKVRYATTLCSLVVIAFGALPTVGAADWPTWRANAQRTAETSAPLPSPLHLRWQRMLPEPRPAFRSPRLQFDAGYEPVVAGDTLVIGSPVDDSVAAYDLATGTERWRFFTGGPVRLAPAIADGRVYAGSDDGHLYCLDLATGALRWRFRASPVHRLVYGNGRLISLWPVRGGPAVADGRVYFAAGVWSFEGVFVYALDAESGEVVWVNDSAGAIYGQHPHAAEAMGGVTPQGYLIVAGDELIVPCGTAYPARFDRQTGDLKHFELPRPGRLPGGWFAALAGKDADAKARRRGELVLDRDVNTQRHEDNVRKGHGESGVRLSIVVGGKPLSFADGIAGVDEPVHSMIVAGGKLIVSAKSGALYCFDSEPHESTALRAAQQVLKPSDEDRALAAVPLAKCSKRHGVALVLGGRRWGLVEALLASSKFAFVVLDPDASVRESIRRRAHGVGLYGRRVAVLDSRLAAALPPYFAALVVDGGASGMDAGDVVSALQPYGGVAFLEATSDVARAVTAGEVDLAAVSATASVSDGLVVVRRPGALAGATNYLGGWASPDELVHAPLGVLWFDDALAHFKRSPQPLIVDGVMVSREKDWTSGERERGSDYNLLRRRFSDVYTGRMLSEKEAEPVLARLPETKEQKQPVQYRPQHQSGNPWKPVPPVVGERVNPMTGQREKRAFPKSYGCDGGIDYGRIFTMRSGTPAYYDKATESGTIHISGAAFWVHEQHDSGLRRAECTVLLRRLYVQLSATVGAGTRFAAGVS